MRPAAVAGFNHNDSTTNVSVRFEELPGSETDAVKNLTITSNIGRAGVWMFQVDMPEIISSKLTHPFCKDCCSSISDIAQGKLSVNGCLGQCFNNVLCSTLTPRPFFNHGL